MRISDWSSDVCSSDLIDAVSSWWVNLHGHSNPKIAQAIAAQAMVLEHVIFAGFTHEPAIALSKNLLSILPSDQRKVFRSEERRVGKECVSTCSSRWSPYH